MSTDIKPSDFRLGTKDDKAKDVTLNVLLKAMKEAFDITGVKKWGFKVSGELILNAGLLSLGIKAEFWAEGELA